MNNIKIKDFVSFDEPIDPYQKNPNFVPPQSYAYLDKDKWRFKQAGKCKLDFIKPREEWTLDDFKNLHQTEVATIIINKEGKLIEVFR